MRMRCWISTSATRPRANYLERRSQLENYHTLGGMMNGNFYSNDLLVKIRIDERMAEAEAYRRAMQVEQSNVSERPNVGFIPQRGVEQDR